jgi:hypothetical protein
MQAAHDAIGVSEPATRHLLHRVVPHSERARHTLRPRCVCLQASFQLATCGWVVGPLGARWYFDTVLPPNWR